jgi:Phage tail protein
LAGDQVMATAGMPVTLAGDFTAGGSLTDADAVTLTITFGATLGIVPATAGPFTLAAGQITQTGTGTYAFTWQVPASAETGAYVANWAFTDSAGDVWPATENIFVSGASPLPVPAGDVGFWTGGIINPLAGLDIEFGAVDANGIAWIWQKITGWDGAPVQGAGVIPRSGDHGAWASPQYYAARTITLSATASAPTQALRDVARNELQQAVSVSNLVVLRYDEPIPKQALVRRSGAVTETPLTTVDVTFSIPLVAPDPRKYSATGKTLPISAVPSGAGGDMVVPFTVPFSLAAAPPPASNTAFNAGNFDSPPVAVITGPCVGPSLTNVTTGETVSWSTVTLNSGDQLVIDFLNRQAFLNPPQIPSLPGQSAGGGGYEPADLPSAWWRLQPGTSTIQFGGGTGTGANALVLYWDSYI